MDGLPTDLLGLIYDYLDPYECILTGFQIDVNELNLKWLCYNLHRGNDVGPEFLTLMEKDSTLVKRLIENRNNLRMRRVINKPLERVHDLKTFSDVVKYFCYDDIYRKHNERYLTSLIETRKIRDDLLSSMDLIEIYTRDVAMIEAYITDDPHIIKKTLDIAELRDQQFIDILRYIAHNDVDNFIDIVFESLSFSDLLYRGIWDLLQEYKRIEMIKRVLSSCGPKEIITRFGFSSFSHLIYDYPDIIEYMATLPGYSATTLLQLTYERGYDGPYWQTIVKETPELLINIDVFELFGRGFLYIMAPFTIKLDMVKQIFEHDKPSKRELSVLIEKVRERKRYDLYAYFNELLAT